MVSWTDFKDHTISVSSICGPIDLYARTAGSGPPLVLLHGHPQTSHIWRFVAPTLAEKHTVICPDLRGYGRSSKPSAGSAKAFAKANDTNTDPDPEAQTDHIEYSKREMAKDVVRLLAALGFDNVQFDVLAHDRGARVAHRLALDHPGRVKRMCLLDIAPTLYMYENTDMAFAMGYWHWFFLPQPAPLPEEIMLADPEKYWNLLAGRLSHKGVRWDEEAIAEYKRYYFTPEGVHGACEDYRAAATTDLSHDRASLSSSQLISLQKLKILWGANGIIAKYSNPDALEIWTSHCGPEVEVSGRAVPSGHYIPEQVPEELLKELEGFYD